MPIFLIYSLILCWGNVSNSNVNMKFAQIQYFLSQNVGRTKDIMSPLFQKLGGHVPPFPHKLGPWIQCRQQVSEIYFATTALVTASAACCIWFPFVRILFNWSPCVGICA